MRRGYRSSITVFLCLVFLVFVTIIAAAIDLSRIYIGKAQVERAINSAALSTLAGYSERLKSEFGLLYIDKDEGVLRESIAGLTTANLNPPDDYTGLRMFKYIVDPSLVVVNSNAGKPNEFGLNNPYVLHSQIVEYAKYLVPLDIATENYYGRLYTGGTSSEFNDFQEMFMKVFGIADLVEEQAKMDNVVNEVFVKVFQLNYLINGNILATDELEIEYDYINRPFDETDWLCTGPGGLNGYLNGKTVEEQGAIINGCIERLQKLVISMGKCTDELIPTIFSGTLISNAEAAISEFKDFLEDGKDSFFYGLIDDDRDDAEPNDEVHQKIRFYEYQLDLLKEYDYIELQNAIKQNKIVIDDILSQYIGAVLSGTKTPGEYNSRFFNDDNGYQRIINPPINCGVSPLNNVGDEFFTDFMYPLAYQSEAIWNNIKAFVYTDILSFKKSICAPAGDDLIIYNDGADRSSNSFYDPGKNGDVFKKIYEKDFGGLPGEYSDSEDFFNESVKKIGAILGGNDENNDGMLGDAKIDGLDYDRYMAGFMEVAKFANTVMRYTKQRLDNDLELKKDYAITDHKSLDPYIYDLPEWQKVEWDASKEPALKEPALKKAMNTMLLDDLLINYYSMKNLKSYATQNPAAATKAKVNFEGDFLNDLKRPLAYELEYMLFGEKSQDKCANDAILMLYGARVAQCLNFIYMNAEARKTVSAIAITICNKMPILEPRFTEVKEIVALSLAGIEAVTEIRVLKAGGYADAMKASGDGECMFYMNLRVFLAGTTDAANNSVCNIANVMNHYELLARNDNWVEAEARDPSLPIEPEPAAPTEPEAKLISRFKGAGYNYENHLMLLLSRTSNRIKMQRLQEIINFTQTYSIETNTAANNTSYLDSAYAAIGIQAKVRMGMMFLNMQMFRDMGAARSFRGGYTYDIEWFQMY